MIYVKFKTQRKGNHLHVNVYVSNDNTTYALSGRLGFYPEEYQVICDTLLCGQAHGILKFIVELDTEKCACGNPLPCDAHGTGEPFEEDRDAALRLLLQKAREGHL